METFSRRLDALIRHMAGFLTAAMAALVFLQVFFRYLLDAPLDWSEEMATFAFAWMCLLGASVGLRHDEHPRLDILLLRLPEGARRGVSFFIDLGIVFMLGVLLLYGIKLTVVMKLQRTAALGYSVAFVYAVVPVSAFVMLVHMAARIPRHFRKVPGAEE